MKRWYYADHIKPKLHRGTPPVRARSLHCGTPKFVVSELFRPQGAAAADADEPPVAPTAVAAGVAATANAAAADFGPSQGPQTS